MSIKKRCPFNKIQQTLQTKISLEFVECMENGCALWDQSDLKCGILSIPYEIARHRREMGLLKEIGSKIHCTLKGIELLTGKK